jgi:Tol biopolymer transport system component
MNCEQVEELLSAYLDGTLAVGETAEAAHQLRLNIAAHLAKCVQCSAVLADFRRFDALLAQMPRVSPDLALRNRIFTSPEYLELTGTNDISTAVTDKDQTAPYRNVRRDTPGRPQLVALPGGRRSSSSKPEIASPVAIPQQVLAPPIFRKRRSAWGLRVMQTAIAAAILLTLGIGSLIGWNLWLQNNTPATSSKMYTPPAGPSSRGPLSAGMHFVFLRDGALWSAPADASTPAEQLTAKDITVAANWVVSSPLPGRSAGNMLAYIDLQRALVHTIRSDGLRDTVVQQPLLKAGIAPSSVWDTEIGETILNSLTWSKDGSMLAFIADPSGTGSTSLYILSTATGTVQMVSLPMKGSVSYPVWSPDSIRIAFALTNNGTTSILDYNSQNHGLLVITRNINSQAYPNDMLLTLDWSPDTNTPAITWSVGVIGHVHSIWVRHVGAGSTTAPQSIIIGDFVQAIYSRNGHGGVGSWLLVTSFMGRAANLWRIDVTPGASPVALTSGKQVNFAQWSPDGAQVDYLDSISSGVGMLHVVNTTTVVDTFIAKGVADEPVPAWSEDGQHLVYSTGTQTIVVNVQGNKKLQPLTLRGSVSTFVWSATSPQQLVVALSDGQQGVYLVDAQHNSALQLDQQAINGPILWTEVP